MKGEAAEHIGAVLEEVMKLMREAFAAVGDRPQPGSSLDQVFLSDGDQVVNDYIEHGEPGVAFDHLMYMVEEPPLPISQSAFEHLRAAAQALGVPQSRLDPIRPD